MENIFKKAFKLIVKTTCDLLSKTFSILPVTEKEVREICGRNDKSKAIGLNDMPKATLKLIVKTTSDLFSNTF